MHYHIRPGLLLQQSGAVLILLDPSNGHYFELNGSGALILQSLKEGLDQDAVIDRLTTHYQIQRSTAAVDVEELLMDLLKAQLIQPGFSIGGRDDRAEF